MKNNRKNRKLKYIREKNTLRLFKSMTAFGKVSQELLKYGDKTEAYFIDYLAYYEKKYKLKLNVYTIDFGYVNNDFPMGLVTFKLRIQRVKNYALN